MFTGIIEETGKLEAVRWGSKSASLKISAHKVLAELKPGDSISTNGACLTVTAFGNTAFEVDVMAETMRSTNLGMLKPGEEINLERAMQLNDRLGGHMVSGHIDGVGKIISFRKEDIATWIDIQAPEQINDYIINKGSVAIDGVSLTVSGLHETGFSVSIIPFTGYKTTLLSKKPGDTVNIECDLVAKYIKKFISPTAAKQNKKLDNNFLKEHGFLD
ncbi:MAG: riboflavin synthase [Bacteroidetes bacterium HGW-Bacteroidetes-11]|jgi:riboflavin synthase|nr:MAG: riboflavin synthase [Bacteroidetes bacterium HGW-Bacteroidetes-11]